MTPTIVTRADGTPLFAVGSPGGSRIIGCVLNTVVSLIDGKLSLKVRISRAALSPCKAWVLIFEARRGAQYAVDAPRAIARNDAAQLEDSGQCMCDKPLLGQSYLESILRARGVKTTRFPGDRSVVCLVCGFVPLNCCTHPERGLSAVALRLSAVPLRQAVQLRGRGSVAR